ncbi:MAG: hypothetical protein J5789_04210 [Oscillospiraceae bacterium]|nr:hypothetical protein [Oscillospiraceae bacterium]
MEQTQDKALGLLGLARKAAKLQTGEETVGSLLLQKRARLTLLASDAGSAVARKMRSLAEGTRQRVIEIPYDKLTLGSALGKQSVSVAAFMDVSMALAFVKALSPELADPALLEDLDRRVARVKAKRKKN